MSIVLLNIPPRTIMERRYDAPNFPDPSLGALYTYLKVHHIPCEVIDSKLERLNLAQVVKILNNIKPHVLGFTSYTHEIERVACAARIIKQAFPEAKLIIGGQHANALPGRILSDFPVFDIAVFGEGEQTLLELSKKYFQNLETIQGIAYRKNKDILINPNRPFLSLDNLPQIDWTGFRRASYYPVFTSRGCAYRCIFCARPFGGRVRYRPLQQVFEEIKQVTESYHPKLIYFWDENLTLDRSRTQELLELIKADHVTKNIKWFCHAHVNNLDYDLLKSMKEAGCIRLGIGIESGNEEILRRINKSMSKTKVIKVVEWLKEIKLPFEGFFLLGLPNENWQTSMETIDFATKLNPKFPVFGIVVPYPGTELYNIARDGKEGYRIIAAGWSDYNKVIGKAMELEGLSRKKLELLQFYAYASVLIRNGRIFDSIRFIFQFYRDIGGYISNFLSNFSKRNSPKPDH